MRRLPGRTRSSEIGLGDIRYRVYDPENLIYDEYGAVIGVKSYFDEGIDSFIQQDVGSPIMYDDWDEDKFEGQA